MCYKGLDRAGRVLNVSSFSLIEAKKRKPSFTVLTSADSSTLVLLF